MPFFAHQRGWNVGMDRFFNVISYVNQMLQKYSHYASSTILTRFSIINHQFWGIDNELLDLSSKKAWFCRPTALCVGRRFSRHPAVSNSEIGFLLKSLVILIDGTNPAPVEVVVAYPIIYQGFIHPSGAGFLHQPYLKTSWWFQPNWKILVKLDHFPPSRDEHKRYLKPPPR